MTVAAEKEGKSMMEPRRMTLEEARSEFIGKPLNFETENALNRAGLVPLLYGRKIAIIRPMRKCSRFEKK